MACSRILLVAIFGMMLNVCCCYPTGAPLAACNLMFPTGHNTQFQTTASLFDITPSAMTYCGGVPITVDLSMSNMGTQFRGFLCQPRTNMDVYETVGTFDTPTGTQNNCDKTALTHTSRTLKKSVKFTWTPDVDATDATVYIVCTVVEEKVKFWKQSVSIQYAGATKCANKGLPSSCSTDQECEDAVTMATCVQGKCQCPADMKLADPTHTYCSPKVLGDECTSNNDCMGIADTVCDGGMCKCEQGFKYNKTSGPCYPKILHDSCSVNDDCRLIPNSVCSNGKCNCPSVGYFEVGNATHKNCSTSKLPVLCSNNLACSRSVTLSICEGNRCVCPAGTKLTNPADAYCSSDALPSVCTNNQECDDVIRDSVCDGGKCVCPANSKFAKPGDKFCTTDSSTAPVVSLVLFLGCLLMSFME
ncbi:hypothetical protein ACF0H5_016151 [Mactra antiquata]